MKIKHLLATLLGIPVLTFAVPAAAAATTIVVTPDDEQGWNTADTRINGEVNFVEATDAPLGEGALELKTGEATGSPLQDKAQYLHAADVTLSEVTDLGYSTNVLEASFDQGAPSYQLIVCLTGDVDGVCNPNATPVTGNTTSFTTLVYEPYQNGGTIVPDTWQTWDVDAGQFWSSRTANCEGGGVQAGGGGTFFYTLADLLEACPDASVVGFGVNVGSNNPNYDTLVDAVVFNDTTYDFEVEAPLPEAPTTKDECKDGGWQNFQMTFKNQGDCVSYVASAGKAKGNPVVVSNKPTF